MTQGSSQERDVSPLLLLFTAATGLVDAVSYISLGHVFTANMTGNIILLGFASVGTPGLSVSRSLTAIGAFLVGAIRFTRINAECKGKPIPSSWEVRHE